MTFAFIEARGRRAVRRRRGRSSPCANPLSEKYAVLRPSLLPGLDRRGVAQPPARAARRAAVRDRHALHARPARRARSPASGAGAGAPPHWSGASRAVDFYDVKGVVEALGRALGVELDYAPASVPVSGRGTDRGGRASAWRRPDRRRRRDRPARAGDSRRARLPGGRRAVGVRARPRRAGGAAIGRRPARRIAAALPVGRARPLGARR